MLLAVCAQRLWALRQMAPLLLRSGSWSACAGRHLRAVHVPGAVSSRLGARADSDVADRCRRHGAWLCDDTGEGRRVERSQQTMLQTGAELLHRTHRLPPDTSGVCCVQRVAWMILALRGGCFSQCNRTSEGCLCRVLPLLLCIRPVQ